MECRLRVARRIHAPDLFVKACALALLQQRSVSTPAFYEFLLHSFSVQIF
jgi:hypothetical protein